MVVCSGSYYAYQIRNEDWFTCFVADPLITITQGTNVINNIFPVNGG